MNGRVSEHRSSGAAWLALAAGLAFALPGVAQDVELEEIIVTGSRIARPDFESASPIVSITQERFRETGATSVELVMNRLPQLVPDATSTSNNPGRDGQAHLQLRGLGPHRTLVLLDGRRIVPANAKGIVDANVIPPSLIESVEIITGGASAVYGADAVAGVINFKLKQEFDGLQFDGSYAQTEHGDGDDYSVGVTAGSNFADDRGHVYGYVGYSERASITRDERDFSRYALAYFGPDAGGIGPDGGFLPQGSSVIPEGVTQGLRPSQEAFDALFESYGYPAGTVPYQDQFGFNPDGTLFTMGDFRTLGSVANFRGERDPFLFNDRRYSYNYAPLNYLRLPLERVWAFGRADYEFDSGHAIFGQALYADYSADTAHAPTPAFFLSVPVTNPYISPDHRLLLESRADPAADQWYMKRLVELGPRIAASEYDVYQLTVGVDGPLPGRWTYEAYAQYGENDRIDSQQGNALRSRIHELTYAADGGESICGEFDLFAIGRISDDCAKYISAEVSNRQGYEQTIFEVSATGPAVSLPAGDLRAVLGIMHKRDEYFYKADATAAAVLDDGFSDLMGFSATNDLTGSDYNTDFYVEALVPILADQTAVRKLETVLGYRYSDYKLAGGVDSWKAELLYQPVDPLMLRGSLQRAVRAPNIFELYEPQLPWDTWLGTNFDYDLYDPCVAGSPERTGPDSAQVEALCLAQGVPAEQLSEFQADGTVFGVYGGNPDLEPEEADTLTLGFVVNSWSSSSLWSGMQLSLDWYRIEVEHAIERVSIENALPLCFDADVNPGFADSNLWCQFFSRDPGTGEIADFTDILFNIDGFEVSGVDLQFDWSLPAGPGSVGLNALVSWMDYFEYIQPRGLPSFNQVGYVGGSVYEAGGYTGLGESRPEWKWTVNLRYDWRSFALGTRWDHVDGLRDMRELQSLGESKFPPVPSYDYFSLFASYSASQGALNGLAFTLGVENLTDEDPPLIVSAPGPNTDASQYDVLGRRYYLRMSYRF